VTVTKSPITGEITEETVKTIARGMPGVSGVTVVTNARAYYTPRAAAGALSARHSRALFMKGRNEQANPRANHAAGSRSCVGKTQTVVPA
jgi:hypothetical protein